MTPVIDTINKIRKENQKARAEIAKSRTSIELNPEDFKALFLELAQKELLKKGIDKPYTLDELNKATINDLYYYITRSLRFSGNLDKGILLAGSIGVGKTIIMNVICSILEERTNKIFIRTHAKRIPELMKSCQPGHFDRRPMLIDDLAREPREVNNYGTKELPIIDLMSIRYDCGALTFATTNFNQEALTEFYGEATIDRFREMFNTIIITGKSRRV
jgi:DNA replication protein DnaC